MTEQRTCAGKTFILVAGFDLVFTLNVITVTEPYTNVHLITIILY